MRPSHRPSISQPTLSPTTPRPTISQPTIAPTVTDPTGSPTNSPLTSYPTVLPSDVPSLSPSVSSPTTSPSLHPTHSRNFFLNCFFFFEIGKFVIFSKTHVINKTYQNCLISPFRIRPGPGDTPRTCGFLYAQMTLHVLVSLGRNLQQK